MDGEILSVLKGIQVSLWVIVFMLGSVLGFLITRI